MGEVLPIPRLGGVVRDARGAGRALRVSWHGEDGLVVLSLWHGTSCTGTVRVAAADVPALVEALQLGLRPPLLEAAPEPIGRTEPAATVLPATEPARTEPAVTGLDIVTGPVDQATG